MPILDRRANLYQFTHTEKELIRQMLKNEAHGNVIGIDEFKTWGVKAKLPTELELDLFIQFCSTHRMNPLVKDVYFQKRHGKVTYITSIDRLRSVAEETECYAPGRSPLFYDENGQLQPGGMPHHVECFVEKRTTDGTWHEVSDYAYFEEYAQITPWGYLDQTWAKMPRLQLAKCGEACVLRKAFPQQLGELCIFEEAMRASHSEPCGSDASDFRTADRANIINGIIAEITRDDKVVLCELNDRSLVRLLRDGSQ